MLHVASHPARTAASVRSCPIGLGNGRPGRQSSSGFAPSSRGIASRSKQQPEPRGKARQCRRATHWSVQHEARAAYSSCSPERREQASIQHAAGSPGTLRGDDDCDLEAASVPSSEVCGCKKKKMIINHQKANQSGNKNACVATPPADKQYAHFYPLLSIDAAGAGRTKGMHQHRAVAPRPGANRLGDPWVIIDVRTVLKLTVRHVHPVSYSLLSSLLSSPRP